MVGDATLAMWGCCHRQALVKQLGQLAGAKIDMASDLSRSSDSIKDLNGSAKLLQGLTEKLVRIGICNHGPALALRLLNCC